MQFLGVHHRQLIRRQRRAGGAVLHAQPHQRRLSHGKRLVRLDLHENGAVRIFLRAGRRHLRGDEFFTLSQYDGYKRRHHWRAARYQMRQCRECAAQPAGSSSGINGPKGARQEFPGGYRQIQIAERIRHIGHADADAGQYIRQCHQCAGEHRAVLDQLPPINGGFSLLLFLDKTAQQYPANTKHADSGCRSHPPGSQCPTNQRNRADYTVQCTCQPFGEPGMLHIAHYLQRHVCFSWVLRSGKCIRRKNYAPDHKRSASQ